MVWYSSIWYEIVRYGMVWYGLVWFGMVDVCWEEMSEKDMIMKAAFLVLLFRTRVWCWLTLKFPEETNELFSQSTLTLLLVCTCIMRRPFCRKISTRSRRFLRNSASSMLRLAAWTPKAGKGLPIHSIHKKLIVIMWQDDLAKASEGALFSHQSNAMSAGCAHTFLEAVYVFDTIWKMACKIDGIRGFNLSCPPNVTLYTYA